MDIATANNVLIVAAFGKGAQITSQSRHGTCRNSSAISRALHRVGLSASFVLAYINFVLMGSQCVGRSTPLPGLCYAWAFISFSIDLIASASVVGGRFVFHSSLDDPGNSMAVSTVSWYALFGLWRQSVVCARFPCDRRSLGGLSCPMVVPSEIGVIQASVAAFLLAFTVPWYSESEPILSVSSSQSAEGWLIFSITAAPWIGCSSTNTSRHSTMASESSRKIRYPWPVV